MALTEVQHTRGSAIGTAALNVTITAAGSGNLVVVGVIWSNSLGQTISSVTDNATPPNIYTLASGGSGSNSAGNSRTDIYYCGSVLNSPTQVTVNKSVASGYVAAFVFEVSGFASIPSVDDAEGTTNAVGDGSGNDSGATVNVSRTPAFVAAVLFTADVTSQNPKTGNEFTSGGDTITGNAGCSLITSSMGNHQPVWLDSSTLQNYSSSTAAFSPLPGDTITVQNQWQVAVN